MAIDVRYSMRIIEDNNLIATFSMISIRNVSYRLRVELFYDKGVKFKLYLLSGTSRTVIKENNESDDEGDYLEIFSTKHKKIDCLECCLKLFFFKSKIFYGVSFYETRANIKIIADTIYRMVHGAIPTIAKSGTDSLSSKYLDFDLIKSRYDSDEDDSKLVATYNSRSSNVFPRCKYKIGFSTELKEEK